MRVQVLSDDIVLYCIFTLVPSYSFPCVFMRDVFAWCCACDVAGHEVHTSGGSGREFSRKIPKIPRILFRKIPNAGKFTAQQSTL